MLSRPTALAVLALAVVACGGGAPTYDPLPPGTVVLAFGDSVTYGTGAGRDNGYPVRLAELTGWEVVNAGIPGDTAKNARSRIDEALDTVRPALVIIELGGNDFLRRAQPSLVKEDLRAIIRSVRAAGAIPVVVAVPQVSLFGAATGTLSDAGIFEELADEERIVLIEGVFARVLSDDALRADRIHPNAEGYREMAQGFADALADVGLLRR